MGLEPKEREFQFCLPSSAGENSSKSGEASSLTPSRHFTCDRPSTGPHTEATEGARAAPGPAFRLSLSNCPGEDKARS